MRIQFESFNLSATMKKKVVEAEYQIDLLNNTDPAKNYVLSKYI